MGSIKNMTPKKIAFVFPGQGSQSVGMLQVIASQHPIIQETFTEASEALGYDLWALVQAGPAEKLDHTEYTQPALLTAGVALWRWWLQEHEARPAVMAGHSLGEYTALVCADALPLNKAAPLVALRGRLMQAAVPNGEGAMAAILGLENETVRVFCEEETTDSEIVALANYNTIGQVVVSGHTPSVLRVIDKAKLHGAKRAIRLPVSVPSHCLLMKPAGMRLKEALNDIPFKLPSIPIIHNADMNVHYSIDQIRQALVEQLHQPVRWVDIIRFMALDGVNTILECGPGTVLTGLNKRIVATLDCQSLSKGDLTCL